MRRAASVRAPTTTPKLSPRGYAGTNASGKSASRAPPAAASAVRHSTFAIVASRSMMTGAACTTATRAVVHDSAMTPPAPRE